MLLKDKRVAFMASFRAFRAGRLDMLHGSVWDKLLIFVLPLALSCRVSSFKLLCRCVDQERDGVPESCLYQVNIRCKKVFFWSYLRHAKVPEPGIKSSQQ